MKSEFVFHVPALKEQPNTGQTVSMVALREKLENSDIPRFIESSIATFINATVVTQKK